MRIQVTQDHINRGVRGSCSSDPIYLAMKDAGFHRPWASPERIKAAGFGGKIKHFSVATPENVLLFMQAFDNQKPACPFEFEFETEES